jgi:NDP-sugar pyrophosphorylase family protein
MSGFGKRFTREGYKTPKPLLKVEGKTIIEHVLSMFPEEKDVTFICNREHLETTDMRKILRQVCPKGNILSIEPHTLGPVHAVLSHPEIFDTEEPIIINYCDFYARWNYQDFKRFVQERRCDGCITAYRGFHPHSLGDTMYAYMRHDVHNRMVEIKEKACFTNNRMQEFASAGTYYFRSGAIAHTYLRKAVQRDIRTNGEYYVSEVYNLLNEDGLRVYIYELDFFCQWGTPKELEEYIFWSNTFRAKNAQRRQRIQYPDLQILMPMAGQGNRFAQKGHSDIKPLIQVNGKPMFVQAMDDLMPENKKFFLCRKEHLSNTTLKEAIDKHYPSSTTVQVDGLTQGQACTCLLAETYIDDDRPLLITACDNGLIWSSSRFDDFFFDDKVDAVVWTAKNHRPAGVRPQAKCRSPILP